MYKILAKEQLAPTIYKYVIDAPLAAKNAQPGQFVIIIPNKNGERIPLTIVNSDNLQITIIFQVLGQSTEILASLNQGDNVEALLGPLGHAAEIKNFGKVICVGGGIGIAALITELKALKDAGNSIYSILGAREKSLIILEKEIKDLSDKIIITTDDGSYGEKGLVTIPLKRILENEKIDLVIAIGPVIMMKAVAELTKQFNVKTMACLNPIMVDGIGMCGACRVEINNETKFACVDGPTFDAHEINFEQLLHRTKQYPADHGDKSHV